MKAWSSEKISVLALVLLITGAIDSIRNLPTTALFGSTLIFFFIISSIVFLIPVALIAAELSSTWSEEEGGIYSWVRHAFGENLAFFTIWLQWINTIVWYPTILLFIAGTLAYLVAPEAAQHKLYLISVVLTCFWLLTFLGTKGLNASATFAGFCAVVGMILPMVIIILLAITWLAQGKETAIELTYNNLIPDLAHPQTWSSLTAIMTSFLGMELAAVHVRNIRDPQHNFPKAMFLSVILILVTMILGSLSIAFVLPAHQISLVHGVMQAISSFLRAYHLEFLMPLMVLMLLLGSLGSMVNWIISPAKGLLLAANDNFLPKWLYHHNKHGMPSRILVLQALLVTLLCTGFVLLPSVNAVYWLFTALSTELYILMYVLMFLAAIRLKYKFAHKLRPFKIPGGLISYYGLCLLGIIGCIITLIVGFFPPEEAMNLGSANRFRLIFSAGIILMLIPISGFYLYKYRQQQTNKYHR